MSSARRKEPMYKAIFAIYHKPSSGCEFFEVEEREGYYFAYCRVLQRYLTKDSAIKCESYWKTCPFRRIGLQMEEVEEASP
jgi:hypothetical protein